MRRRPLRRVSGVIASLAAAAMVVAGCGDRTGPGDTQVHYQFSLTAFGGDTTAERSRTYDCLIYGFFDIDRPVAVSGSVRFPLRVERRFQETRGRHLELTMADSSIAEAEMSYVGFGDDSLRFVLTAGPYIMSFGPGGVVSSVPQEYSGEWTCGPEVPLARDSTLLAYGFDGDMLIEGVWRVSELVPID